VIVSVSPYKAHGIVSVEDGAMVFRWCVERLSDGEFAVVHTEFHDPLSDPEKELLDTITPIEKLHLTTSDEADWQFYATIQEAIVESKVSMTAYSEWMKHARDF
jgi:hypothetical protein